jgi:hypothetical protein
MIEKIKITVWDYTNAIHGGTTPVTKKEDVGEYEVDAWCVGGEEGIKAYFYMGNLFCTAHGDDGHWWLVGRMGKQWVKEMKKVVAAIEEVE